MDKNCLYKTLWLWIPIFVVLAQIVFERMFASEFVLNFLSEGGPHELLQFLVISAAFFVAVSMVFKVRFKEQKFLFFWVSLAALCCFYVAVEEVSWGQHVFEWTTPEFWSQVNDQNETNFHNTSSWLDQKPRILLEMGVVVGGLIFPLIMKFRPKLLPERFSIIYPSGFLAVTAGGFLILKLVDKADVFGILPFVRASEIQELYLFYFVLLYMIILRKKIA